MVAKIDFRKNGGKVKGADEFPRTAEGNAPNTGMPRSPAPDVISTPRASKSGYGMNSWAGPSSLTPMDDSNKGVSPMAANLKTSGERGSDAVLDAVIREGVGAGSIDPMTGDVVTMAEGVAGSQIRKIGAKNVPDSFGMESARSRQATYPGVKEKIPATTGATDEQPRKP